MSTDSRQRPKGQAENNHENYKVLVLMDETLQKQYQLSLIKTASDKLKIMFDDSFEKQYQYSQVFTERKILIANEIFPVLSDNC